MKKFICLALVLSSFSQSVIAGTCDWSTGITPGPNNTYIYSLDCHLAVGQLVANQKIQTQQISDLTQAISLKNLALQDSDSRAMLWQKSSDNELDRLNKIEGNQKMNDWLYYGLGVVTVLGAGFMAAKLMGK